jgi:parallel beta-helix repeat protein
MKNTKLFFAIFALFALIANVFSIDITECQVLDIAGATYNLQNDVSSTNTCFNIIADNITLDCLGNDVVGSNSDSSDGVFINNGKQNITVKNCRISQYSNGIKASDISGQDNVSRITVINNTVYSNSWNGIWIVGEYTNITNNEVYQNRHLGIEQIGNYGIIAYNTVYDNSYDILMGGIYSARNSNGQIINNIAHSSSGVGIYLELSQNTYVANNIAFENNNSGIVVASVTNSTIFNNTAYDNNISGIGVSYYFPEPNNNLFVLNNSAYNNTQHGIYVTGTFNSTIANNTALSNDKDGIFVSWESANNLFTKNNVFSNKGNGFRLENIYPAYDYSPYNNSIIENDIRFNNLSGIKLGTSSNNLVEGNFLIENGFNGSNGQVIYSYSGIYSNDSENNTIRNNLVHGSAAQGIEVRLGGNN